MSERKKIAVITGASSGMGREFVLALDKEQEFDELWLIARRRDKLEELNAETRAPVRAIALDLGIQTEIDKYKDKIAPAIILIPGKDGPLGLGQNALRAAVERAVGSDIL